MAAYELLLLNTTIPQIQAAQSGDTYVVPRDIAFSTVASFAAGAEATPSIVATGDTNTGIWFPAADTVAISTGGTSRLRLDSSGNLGLGVTPSAWAGGFNAMQFSGGAVWSGIGYQGVNQNAFYNGSNWIYRSTATATNYEQNAGQHRWFNAASGTAGNPISFTQAMTLDASGNLGVGTTNPTRRISAVNTSSGGPIFEITGSGGAGNELGFGVDTTGGYLQQLGSKPISFYTGGSERARITSGGVFGVGCDPTAIWPSAASSSGDNGSTIAKTYVSVSSNASILQYLNRNDGDGTITTYYRTGTAVGSVSVTSTATAYNTSSDYRLKDNPQPLTGSGAFIDALQPKTWVWKENGKAGVGFIAHEVQAISPGSVVGEKDAVDADGKPIMQAMEYGSAEFIANIVAELQSLRARVKALEGA